MSDDATSQENMLQIAAKISMLEKLIELLYVSEFERTDDPISAARELSERAGAAETSAWQKIPAPDAMKLQASENLNLFFDRVIANLHKRGHQG